MQLHEDLSSQNQLSPPAQSGVENTSQTSAIPGREEEGSERTGVSSSPLLKLCDHPSPGELPFGHLGESTPSCEDLQM